MTARLSWILWERKISTGITIGSNYFYDICFLSWGYRTSTHIHTSTYVHTCMPRSTPPPCRLRYNDILAKYVSKQLSSEIVTPQISTPPTCTHIGVASHPLLLLCPTKFTNFFKSCWTNDCSDCCVENWINSMNLHCGNEW